MPNVSFRVESIRAERYSFEAPSQLNVNVNIMLGKLERRGKAYEASFVVKLEYTPPIASIEVKGVAHVVPTSDKEKKELEQSLKSKRTPPTIAASVYGYVFPVIALLSREVGLPPPIPMPLPPPQQLRKDRGAAPGYV